MRDYLIFALNILFWICVASIVATVTVKILKQILDKRSGREFSGKSIWVLISGEVSLGGAFLAVKYVLLRTQSDVRALLGTSFAVLVIGFAWGIFIRMLPYNRKRVISFSVIMPVAVYIAGALTFFAVYYYGLRDGTVRDGCTGEFYASLLAALHHSARLFALDGGYSDTIIRIAGESFAEIAADYVLFIGILYFVAAFATFTTLLTIVKNISAKARYFFTGLSFWRSVHVFSSLSDESLALAESLTAMGKNAGTSDRIRYFLKRLFGLVPVIVFTSTSDTKENVSKDLVEEAKERGAILFSKDLSAIKFRKTGHTYYVMGTNEGEKLRVAKDIIEYYGDYNGNKLYVFSETAESEMFLNTLEPGRMKLVRVNAIQSLIYRSLYENGIRLFKGAAPDKYGSGERVISAVIVGLGLYGREMLKALTWFCQMDGYTLKINAYDNDVNAETKLRQACPELMDMSDNTTSGEAHYSIRVHRANIDSKEFYDHLSTVSDVSFVFVCLGDDELNLHISKSIRELYEGLKRSKGYFRGRHFGAPDIETVIYDSMIKEMLSSDWSDESFHYCDRCIDGARNFKNQPYRIHVIGDLKSFYSVDTLGADDKKNALVAAGKRVHLRWALADFTNDRYKAAILAHIKDSKSKNEETVWLVEPRLDLASPTMKRLSIKDIIEGNCQRLGMDEEHYSDIKKALLKEYKAADFDDAVREKLVNDSGMIYFIHHVLTKNYVVCKIGKREYASVKTPAETIALKIEGEDIPSGSASTTFKERLAKRRKERRDERERRKVRADGEKTFWRYSYYYRSSLAKAIHENLRKRLAEDESLIQSEVLRNAFKKYPAEDRTEEELNVICKIEHLRWNAFTRAEGYSYGESRYDLAKLHNDLIATDGLTSSELRKDA